MNMSPEEINSIAVAIASYLACGRSKDDISFIKQLLYQIIINLGTYL